MFSIQTRNNKLVDKEEMKNELQHELNLTNDTKEGTNR
jgi:hypothetical protein